MEADFYREKRRENKTSGGDWMVGKLWETDISFLYAFINFSWSVCGNKIRLRENTRIFQRKCIKSIVSVNVIS